MERQSLISRPKRRWYHAYTVDSFFRKQNLQNVLDQQKEGASASLKRSLTLWDLIFYGLAATLGTGIFVTVGQVAKLTAGPSIAISFVLAGFASFLSALCYSEFASRIPVSGSAYSFAYISLGEVVGWFVGWNLTLEYAISASAVAGGWSQYLAAAFHSIGHPLPEWLIDHSVTIGTFTFHIYIMSAVIVMLCTGVLLLGMKESARFNLGITIINILIILFFIIFGATHVNTDNLHNFFPYNLEGTWKGVGVVFFSYIGFDSVSTLAAEVKRPGRDLPIGIMGTLSIVTLFYVAVSIVLTGMIPYDTIDVKAPLAAAFESIHQNWASTVIAVGSVTTISATTLTSLVGQPRVFFQMAKDGLIFSVFKKTNRKGVPVLGTIITGTISAVIAFLLDLSILLDMISIGTLLAFTVVCAGVIILRFQDVSPAHPTRKSNRVPYMVILYFLACVLFSSIDKLEFPVTNEWKYVMYGVFFLPIPLTFIPLCFLKEDKTELAFRTPFVPFIPCLGIFMNVWFILTLSIDSIIRLIIWTSIGMTIYLFYGIHNSTLNEHNKPMFSVVERADMEKAEAEVSTHEHDRQEIKEL